jgi:8-oxo-dGTP pyrophosphatase MutT (NUDIX family)
VIGPSGGATPQGTWIDHGDTVIYDCEWLRLVTTDVVLPDGTRIDHHVVRMPHPAAGCVMIDRGRVLLLHRHRFVTDTWGWEIPAGAIDPGEAAADGARREALEESGWEPVTLTPLCRFHPANGVLDQAFHIFTSTDAVHRGEPEDPNEAARIEWVPVDEVRRLLLDGEIVDGLTLGAIAFAFTAGVLG